MKHEKFFQDFLSDHVNLNQTRIDTLEEHLKAIIKLFREKLSNYKKYSAQGSYAHKTIIKPVQDNDEFDADILVFIQDNDFKPSIFKTDYVDELYNFFNNRDTYKGKIKRQTRCVTINYAGDFHLDIVPCIEHESICYICNRKDKKYEKTDGDGYKDWLREKNNIIGGNNFRKTTRLLKFLRDHKNTFSVKSILLTTILGNSINDNDRDSGYFSDLPTTLKTLSDRVNQFLQEHEQMPIINNPVLEDENFNRHWDSLKYKNFRNKFNSYNIKITEAFEEKEHDTSVKKWRELFGDKFGKIINSTTTNSQATAIIPTISATKPYANYDSIFKKRF